jgi:hypothetical protein
VSEVARHNGLSPQQLFHDVGRPMRFSRKAPTRRRLIGPGIFRLRGSGERIGKCGCPACDEEPPAFAPVVIAAAPSSPPPLTASGAVEIAAGDTVVRLIGPVENSVLIAVLRAVRRTSDGSRRRSVLRRRLCFPLQKNGPREAAVVGRDRHLPDDERICIHTTQILAVGPSHAFLPVAITTKDSHRSRRL